jgi:hypothetical protein
MRQARQEHEGDDKRHTTTADGNRRMRRSALEVSLMTYDTGAALPAAYSGYVRLETRLALAGSPAAGHRPDRAARLPRPRARPHQRRDQRYPRRAPCPRWPPAPAVRRCLALCRLLRHPADWAAYISGWVPSAAGSSPAGEPTTSVGPKAAIRHDSHLICWLATASARRLQVAETTTGAGAGGIIQLCRQQCRRAVERLRGRRGPQRLPFAMVG